MTKWRFFGTMFLFGLYGSALSQTQIEFNNTSGGCPRGSLTSCTSATNSASFYVETQDADDAPPNSAILPRFKAFWITGDGNYLEFDNSNTDSVSRNPPPYNYANAGTYNVAVYLTGKYTNHNPPPGAAREISVGAPPNPLPAGSPLRPTRFKHRTNVSNEVDFFPVHDIRKDYLIPLVMSYPVTMDSTWVYLFFNGRDDGTAWNERPLKYEKTELPNYYNGDKASIKSYDAAELANGIDNNYFQPGFINFRDKYSDLLYFPLETATSGSLPTGFTKKRYFPVFWADDNVVINPGDSLMSFCFLVTGPKPIPDGSPRFERVSDSLRVLGLDLSLSNPINIPSLIDLQRLKKITAQQPGPVIIPQYIQGVYVASVEYVSAHDPNQLTVKSIELLPDGNYKVTFHLEMCNKGGGRTDEQKIDLFDRFGRFRDFSFGGNPVAEMPAGSRHYIMTSNLGIEGIPDDHYEMMCKAIEFSAVTSCDGIRSLWNTNFERPFEVCVKFKEAFDTECSENMQIDSCDFKIDNRCVCAMNTTPTCGGGTDWMLVFVLLVVLILLAWKYIQNQAA